MCLSDDAASSTQHPLAISDVQTKCIAHELVLPLSAVDVQKLTNGINILAVFSNFICDVEFVLLLSDDVVSSRLSDEFRTLSETILDTAAFSVLQDIFQLNGK